MIDDSLTVDYLKPDIWKNLGAVLDPLINKGRVLHILQNEEGKYRAYDSEHREFLITSYIDSDGNSFNLDKIFEEHCDIIEIRTYTVSGLKSYYKKLQERTIYSQDIDDYLSNLYSAQEDTEGIAIYMRDSAAVKKRNYMEILKSIRELNNDNVVVLVWLTDKYKLFFNCILKISFGRLTGISTYDRYGDCEENYETVYSLVQKEYRCEIISVKMMFDEYIRKAIQIFQ